jgi:hypothetical protein
MNLNEVDKPKVTKTVVVYSGRFQPFHKGHYVSYLKLCNKFGRNNVYIGTSNDTSGPKSPFNFDEKVKIMTTMFGIPSDKIVQVKNPYAPKEILSKFDGKATQYIAAVGEKDANRLAGKYFKPYNGKAGYGYEEIGYVYPVPAETNAISGTDVRSWLGKDSKDKEKGFLKAYPKFDKDIYKMITGKLNEEGLPGGVGVGLVLPGGYINGAPTGSTNESNNTQPSTEFRKEPHPTRHETEHPSDEPDWHKKNNPYDPISEIIGRIAAEEIFEEFVKTYFKEESEGEKLGLVHLGGGYYGKEKGQPATHKSENGKLRALTPAEAAAEKQKHMAKGPSDAPVNEPKPSQPGQPVNKGATTQGKVDKKKEEPTADKKGGEDAGNQAPPPEQKLSGVELKSDAEKREDGQGTETEESKKIKQDLDKAISELQPNEQKEVESHNNPDSPERKAMAEQAESGWDKFKKSTMVGRFLAKKQKQYADTGSAIKTLASGKRLGTIKDSEGNDVHWKDLQKKDENGEPMFDKKPVYEKAKKIVKDKDGIDRAESGHRVDKDGNKLGNDGKPIHATNLLGQPKYDKNPIWKDDLTDEQKHLAHESHHKSHEQKHALIHTGIEAAFLVSGVAMAGGIAAGAGVVGKTVVKDIAKHAALETLGVSNPVVAGSAGLAAAHFTHHLLEGMYLNENSEEVNTQKLFENIVDTTIQKFKTYKLSDEQLLKVVEKYKKDKPKEDLQNLLKEDISDSKKQNIQHFVEYATKRLKLAENPKITLIGGKEYGNVKSSLGGYNPEDKTIYVSTEGRLTADILRTIAHEMVHRKQDEMGYIKDSVNDGADGSPIENQAHSIAGILMREYGRINKQIYNEDINIDVDKGDTVLMGKFKNKKVVAKDFGTDDHGMPTINGKVATTFRIPRGEKKANPQSVFNEVGSNDWHFKAIMKLWDKSSSFTRKKIGAVILKNPNATRNDIARELRSYGYVEATAATDQLGLDEKKNLKEVSVNTGQDGQQDGAYIPKGKGRVLDGNDGVNKSDDWYYSGGYVQTDFPVADAIWGDDDENQTVVKYSARNLPRFNEEPTKFLKEDSLKELTQGLFAGKIKIGGQPVDLEVELLGADNKTKEFLTKVIHIDKKYQSKLPIGSTFKIPARVFRMPGGGWHKIKSSAFKESVNEAIKWEDDTFHHCMRGELPLSLNIVKQLVDPIKTTSLHVTTIENLPKVAALEGTKKSISTFNKVDKYSKIVQNGKGVDTDGGIFVLVSGVVLAQSIMDLWTYPDKQGRRWVNPGTVIGGLGRETDIVFNFAPHLKPFKKRWLEDPLNEFTPAEKNEFIRLYYKEAEKFMLSKKKEFQDKYLNSNQLYYESDWNEVVLNQIKIEKILAIPSNWGGDDAENQKKLEKLKQKYPKVEVGKNTTDIQNFIRNNGGSIRESINQTKDLIMEGGAYGHMSHPFDDMDLTFGDLKNIIKGALTGKLELTREKTDGQALAISWKNGRLIAARNKSHLQNAGAGAMGIEDVASKFGGRGGLTDAYNFAMKDLSAAISGLSEAQRKKIFNEGQCFMNLEVIWPTSVNVIPYGQALLVFHNTTCYDEKGSAVSANQGAATMLAGMIKQVNADVQSKYTIQGPPVTELPKNEELSSKQTKYLTQLQKLQFQFQLSDKDGVSEYHQAWWEDFVNKSKVKLQKLEKEALVRRWAFGDKSFRLNTIADKDAQKWAIDNDKVNVVKQQKENVRQFEEIFLGVGADVLSFMGSVLTANPDAAVRNMKQRLKDTADKVRGSGDPSKIAKLKMELERMKSIGGSDKIVPNEGIVFVYKGNTYKLTGTFAPLNQILGIFYE